MCASHASTSSPSVSTSLPMDGTQIIIYYCAVSFHSTLCSLFSILAITTFAFYSLQNNAQLRQAQGRRRRRQAALSYNDVSSLGHDRNLWWQGMTLLLLSVSLIQLTLAECLSYTRTPHSLHRLPLLPRATAASAVKASSMVCVPPSSHWLISRSGGDNESFKSSERQVIDYTVQLYRILKQVP